MANFLYYSATNFDFPVPSVSGIYVGEPDVPALLMAVHRLMTPVSSIECHDGPETVGYRITTDECITLRWMKIDRLDTAPEWMGGRFYNMDFRLQVGWALNLVSPENLIWRFPNEPPKPAIVEPKEPAVSRLQVKAALADLNRPYKKR